MASRIAGITIEIDGDTQKFQKSIKEADKQLKTTQSTLKDVNKLLKFDPGNTELLTQKQKNLEKAIDQTKDRLQQLKDAQSQVARGTDEWDRLQREIIETEHNLDGLQGELRNFGSVSAQQIAAAGQKMEEFGNKVKQAGEKMKPLSTAAAGLVTGMVGLGYTAMTTADDLNTLSKQTGISTDSLQKMQYAADRMDVSVETISGAVAKLKKNMDGSGEPFEKLGVAVTDSEGNMRAAEDVFFDVAQALSEIPNEVERDQVAYEIFGKSADQLAGIIDDGGAAFREYGKEAEDLGLILSQDTLNAINKSNDAIDKSKAQFKAAALELGATIATGLAPVIDKLSKGVEKLVGWFQNLTPEQTNLIMTIASVVAAIAPVLIIGGKLISGIGTILKLAPLLGSALTFLVSPIGLVIAGVAALIAIGVLLYKNWDKIKAWAVEKWNAIKDSILTAWENIKAGVALKIEEFKTSISEAWETVKTTVEQKWQEIVDKLKETAGKLKDVGKLAVDKIKEGISSAWSSLTSWFNDIWDRLFKNRKVDVNVDATANTPQGFATGLSYVPYNGFPAILHRGEAVLTAGEAQAWRGGESTAIDYSRLAAAIAERPIIIEGDTNRIFRVVNSTNTTRTRATNYNALARA